MEARDRRLIELLSTWKNLAHGLRCAQRLGLIGSEWLGYQPPEAAIERFVEGWERQQAIMQQNGAPPDAFYTPASAEQNGSQEALATLTWITAYLMGSMHRRTHALQQHVSRDIDARREDSATRGLILPAPYALPFADHMLGADEVRRLREGDALVLDPPIFSAERMRRAHADLLRLERAVCTPSGSPCNTGSLACSLPLLKGLGWPDDFVADETWALLRVLASLPAAIEKHGWPRQLIMPQTVQLGCYSAASGAHYGPHLDRQPWEEHNRREITILLYANHGWDPKRSDGCLRLHPTPAGSAPTRDVEPIAGRLVLFQSGSQRHEVMPCEEGDRLALTLWVEYKKGEGEATGGCQPLLSPQWVPGHFSECNR